MGGGQTCGQLFGLELGWVGACSLEAMVFLVENLGMDMVHPGGLNSFAARVLWRFQGLVCVSGCGSGRLPGDLRKRPGSVEDGRWLSVP